jgi:hypothetical protein
MITIANSFALRSIKARKSTLPASIHRLGSPRMYDFMLQIPHHQRSSGPMTAPEQTKYATPEITNLYTPTTDMVLP